MKKLTIALVTLPLILAGAASFAGMQQHEGQNKCDRDHDMKRYNYADRESNRMDKMSKHLELTEAQQQEMQKLFEGKQKQHQAMREQMQSLHQTTRDINPAAADYDKRLADAKKAASEMATNKIDQMVNMRAEISKILTAEQLSKMDEMKQQHRKAKGDGYDKHHKDGHGMRVQPQE